jgi:hypothetical protein
MPTTALSLLVLSCLFTTSAGEVSLSVEEPAGVSRLAWPVTSGIPLAQGTLSDPGAVSLHSTAGADVPLQTAVLARWPDGSIRWLLLDFQVDLAPRERQQYVLRYGDGVRPRVVDGGLQVTQEAEQVTIRTGPTLLRFSSQGFRPLDAVWFDADGSGTFADDERATSADGAGIVLATPDGRQFRADLAAATMAVEEAGPLRACLRFTGQHATAQGAIFTYIVRMHVFRGQPAVKLYYTFVNDCQESLLASLESLELRLTAASAAEVRYLLDGQQSPGGRVFQVDEARCEVDGRGANGRARGWAAMAGGRVGTALGVREFWQNWPKSIEARSGQLRVGICPDFPAGLYDQQPLRLENKLYYQLRGGVHTFKVGVARTHELWATFFAGAPDPRKLDEFFQAAEQPLLASCDPSHVSATLALGDFPPADPKKYDGYDAWLDRALDAQLRRRVAEREFGMLNYGDWYGEREVNWGNLEYDLAHGLFLQYLRTGDRRFFLRAEQAARHHIDVDVVHAVNPHLKNPYGRPPVVGDIWLHACNHTGGYYENAPLPVDRTYQMGHSTNYGHVWVGGDLAYYYLTGDRRAWDVSRLVADAMAANCPTSYGTHIRSLGWPLILLLHAYDATGDPKYRQAADQEWAVLKKNIDWEEGWVVRLANDHCTHPPGSTSQERETKFKDQRCKGNVPFMEGLTLCGLVRYHRLTHDPEVLRAITVGIDQMIRECWQEDVKTFRYTACPLSTPKPYVLFVLSAEALAYESTLTGNREHLRILREGFRAAVPTGDGSDFGKSLAQMIHFAPYGLRALESSE